MELFVLASDKNNPVVGEKQDDGSVSFTDESYYKPCAYSEIKTDAGSMILPIFSDKVMPNHDELHWWPLTEFLENPLIISAGWLDREQLNAVIESDTETLNKLVYDTFMTIATDKLNQTDDEGEQESILSEYENKTSELNNGGLEAQALHLLSV